MVKIRFINVNTLEILGSVEVATYEGGSAYHFQGKTQNFLFAFGIYFIDEDNIPVRKGHEGESFIDNTLTICRWERMLEVVGDVDLSEIDGFKPIRPRRIIDLSGMPTF